MINKKNVKVDRKEQINLHLKNLGRILHAFDKVLDKDPKAWTEEDAQIFIEANKENAMFAGKMMENSKWFHNDK